MMKRPLLILTTMACLGPLAASEVVNTWRGPQATGVFPARDLVTSADEASGTNIVWRTSLPFIGNNSPVYANGRVFVLTDPGWQSDAPLLHCLDVNTGEMLWEQAVDNLNARPPQEAEWARAERAREYVMARLGRQLAIEYREAGDDEAKRQAVLARAEAEGIRAGIPGRGNNQMWFSTASTRFHGQLAHARPQDYRRLTQEGMFGWEGWYYAQNIYSTNTFPSVVSDGRHVWAFTNLNAVACFDMEGNRRWIIDVRLPMGGHGGGRVTTVSPVIVGDLLIVGHERMFVAVNKETGREVWRHATPHGGSYQAASSPLHFVLGGTDYLYLTSGEMLRAADAKVVGQLEHPAFHDRENYDREPNTRHFGAHAPSIAVGDMIYIQHNGYGGGGGNAQAGLYAFQVRQEGEQVVGDLRWWHAGREGDAIIYQQQSVYRIGGRNSSRFDALTGEQQQEGQRLRTGTIGPIIADNYIITVRRSLRPRRRASAEQRAAFEASITVHFHDKQTMSQVGQANLLADPPEGETLRKRQARVMGPWWNGSSSSPTAWGNRVFVRCHDAIWCIGDPSVPFRE